MSILQLNNVSYQYEKASNKALNNFGFDFECGKLYAIMGKSGAGKTTLLSIISGLDLPAQGEVLYDKKSLASLNRDDYRAKEIGVIFQGYNLLTNTTALDNIILSMEISQSNQPHKKAFALDILRKLGINEEKANRKILKLSGGEQQRVGIARALSHNPNIIIADEPTGNLDSDTEHEIMKIFIQLAHAQNKCVIVVTHSKNVAQFADEVISLTAGSLTGVAKAKSFSQAGRPNTPNRESR